MTRSDLTIRAAVAADEPAVRRLTLLAYAEYEARMTPSAWEGLRRAVHFGLATAAAAHRIVAVRRGDLVGSIMLFPPEADAYGIGGALAAPEVRLLAVHPAARGERIGEALIRACVENARASGASEIGLHSSRSMEAAIRIYLQMGFERVPERDFRPPGAELVQAFRLPLHDLPNS